MQENQKGITLVALVVVIVLLIVVVTVGIAFAFGNNGWGISDEEEALNANIESKLQEIDEFMTITNQTLQGIEQNLVEQQTVVTQTTDEVNQIQNEVTNEVNEVVEGI